MNVTEIPVKCTEYEIFFEILIHQEFLYRQIFYVYKKAMDYTEISLKFREILCRHYFNLWTQ